MQPSEVSRETELQRLLSDERSRCDQYKQIYQMLKEQHQRLQDELTIIHEQLKEANDRHASDKAANESYVQKLEETVKQKQHEIRELTEKVSLYDPEKIRNEVEKEVSNDYQTTIARLLEEADENRKLYSELHGNYTLLKCKSEFSETENISAIESLKSEHRHEVAELKSEIKKLNDARIVPEKDYFAELKEAEKEVRLLHVKLRAAQSECEELSAQNEKAALQHESSSQNFSKQLAEHVATIRLLETEKNSVVAQKEVLSNGLQKCEEERKELNLKLQSARHGSMSLRSELDKLTQTYNLDTANLKRELEKLRSDHESQKTLFHRELQSKRDQIQQLQKDHARSIAEQETVGIQRMVILKQQMWQEFHDIQQELDNAKRHIREIETSKKQITEQFEQKLKYAKGEAEAALLSKSSVEKEISELKSKLDNKSTGSSEVFKNLLEQNSKFREEIEDLKNMITQRFTGTEFLEGGRRMVRSPAGNTDRQTVAELELSLVRQQFEYQQRIDSVESSFKEQRDALVNEKTMILTKQKQYAKLIHKLREKLNSQKLHAEEIEVQNELLKNNVPIEEHLRLKAKLSELQRKQEEFHQVMVAASRFAPIGREEWKSSGIWSTERKYPLSPILHPVSGNGLQSQGSLQSKAMPHHQTVKNFFKSHRRKSTLKQTTKTHQPILNSSSSDVENL